MNPTSKHATKLPDQRTQDCLQWARDAGKFTTLEMALEVLDCQTIGDTAHKKAGRVLTGFRHLFAEIERSRSGSLWRMKFPEDMPEGVLFPLGEWKFGVDVWRGWGFRLHKTTHIFGTIRSARIALIRNA